VQLRPDCRVDEGEVLNPFQCGAARCHVTGQSPSSWDICHTVLAVRPLYIVTVCSSQFVAVYWG